MSFTESDRCHMARALELAQLGRGAVEPNPMVGCVIALDEHSVAEGWHRRFGGPHAEIDALQFAGQQACGATMYVSLEPCSHQGKTPPCVQAIVEAGVTRVVIAHLDPFPEVDGGGRRLLEQAGIRVDTGLLENQSRSLNAPYLKLIETGLPWIIAKWAMTLDGKIASQSGDSQWISNETSRKVVHRLRSLVDAVMVGSGTAHKDDPLLTARPPGPRMATRIVVDSQASLSPQSQLARTADQTPVLIAVSNQSSTDARQRLTEAGCELFLCQGETHHTDRLGELLAELGKRRMTNVLVEGGSRLLGTLFDAGWIDEVHVFIAPKLIGGAGASAPISGQGVSRISEALRLEEPVIEKLDGDLYVHGRILRG